MNKFDVGSGHRALRAKKNNFVVVGTKYVNGVHRATHRCYFHGTIIAKEISKDLR